jgi:hypothetical protein
MSLPSLAGITASEEHGGMGMGYTEHCIAMEVSAVTPCDSFLDAMLGSATLLEIQPAKTVVGYSGCSGFSTHLCKFDSDIDHYLSS